MKQTLISWAAQSRWFGLNTALCANFPEMQPHHFFIQNLLCWRTWIAMMLFEKVLLKLQADRPIRVAYSTNSDFYFHLFLAYFLFLNNVFLRWKALSSNIKPEEEIQIKNYFLFWEKKKKKHHHITWMQQFYFKKVILKSMYRNVHMRSSFCSIDCNK